MIPEIGHFVLWLAAAAALLQAFALAGRGIERLVIPAALAQFALVLVAFWALAWAFMVSDFSVKLVTMNSHTAKPTLYKFTGVWANHEGSLLLWILVMALSGAAVALVPATLGARFKARTLGVMGLVTLGFFAFLLLASNPFERLSPAPTEGQGLNPLLQDPGLAFHPPLLYIGYVGLSVAFAFAVAAMLEGEVGPRWALAVRPWILGAWSFLTLGIALGSFWAYYELGWGGWWFWDPVENAALMPWIAATALFHSVAVLARRDALRNWTLLLAVLAFSLSMLGTFIVRSGLLTSVHAFAVDPTRGLFLMVLIALYVGGALAIYAWKAGSVPPGEGFEPVSREGALVANNLLLSSMLGVVFIGTLYPMALEGMTGAQISVGPPYFNATVVPLLLLMVALMAVGPWLSWQKSPTAHLPARLLPAGIAAASATLVAVAIFDVHSVTALLGFGAAFWLGVASLQILVKQSLTWGAVGMALAHFGVAVSILGATASGALQREALVSMRVGDRVEMDGWQAELVDVRPVAGPNWTALQAELRISREGDEIAILKPQARTFTRPEMDTTEAGLHALWRGDLYAVLGKPDGFGKWQIHFWFRPLIRLIWAGAFLMALGAVLALAGRARVRLPKRRPAYESAFGPQPAE